MTIIPRQHIVVLPLLAAAFALCGNACLSADQESAAALEQRLATLEDLWKTGQIREYYTEAYGIAVDVKSYQSKMAAKFLETLLSKEATAMETEGWHVYDLYAMEKLSGVICASGWSGEAPIEERRSNTQLLCRYLGRIRKEMVPNFKPKPAVMNVVPPIIPPGRPGQPQVFTSGMDPAAIEDPTARAAYEEAIRKNSENIRYNSRQGTLADMSTQRRSRRMMAYMAETFRAGDHPPTFVAQCIETAMLSEEETKLVMSEDAVRKLLAPKPKEKPKQKPKEKPKQEPKQETSPELTEALHELRLVGADDKKTRYAQADQRAAELLQKYTDPVDQGKIWRELTLVYGISGGPPQRIIDCSKKALEFPQELKWQNRLYAHWSVAVTHLLKDTCSVAERRRAATAVYFDGLVAMQKLAPTQNADNSRTEKGFDAEKMKRLGLVLDDDPDSGQGRYLRHNGHLLVVGIVVNYTRQPFDTEELREVAINRTGDPELVDLLVRSVEPKVAARRAKHPPREPSSAMEEEPEESAGWGRLLFALANVVVIVVLGFMVWKQRAHGDKKTE